MSKSLYNVNMNTDDDFVHLIDKTHYKSNPQTVASSTRSFSPDRDAMRSILEDKMTEEQPKWNDVDNDDNETTRSPQKTLDEKSFTNSVRSSQTEKKAFDRARYYRDLQKWHYSNKVDFKVDLDTDFNKLKKTWEYVKSCRDSKNYHDQVEAFIITLVSSVAFVNNMGFVNKYTKVDITEFADQITQQVTHEKIFEAEIDEMFERSQGKSKFAPELVIAWKLSTTFAKFLGELYVENQRKIDEVREIKEDLEKSNNEKITKMEEINRQSTQNVQDVLNELKNMRRDEEERRSRSRSRSVRTRSVSIAPSQISSIGMDAMRNDTTDLLQDQELQSPINLREVTPSIQSGDEDESL